MITFFISLVALILGYIIYGSIAERVFGTNYNNQTPANKMNDGVDYVPLPWWRIFLIQFLNIAGLGPIFGAIAGAMWGPIAFLWIVLGCIFGGAIHDFFSGMMSLRLNGLSIPEIIGKYLGLEMKQFTRLFTVFLMIIVGAVFIVGPAKIIESLTPEALTFTFWVWVVFIYYILATLLPIDKLIGRIYPIFGFALIFMAVSLTVALFVKGYTIPELTFSSFTNMKTNPDKFPVFPMLFVTIACGAISGFHATQSPLMARCITNEKYGKRVFYGAMITEGIVALIWAAIAMSFFGGVKELNVTMTENKDNAAWVVNVISHSLLGQIGSVLAILGVVAAPITSGDTAFRSARLIVADFLNYKQQKIKNRIFVSLPLFAAGFLLTQIDFGIIWRYMAWSNQTLATIVLWTISVFLVLEKKFYWMSLIPAIFMTAVCSTYLLVAPEGFQMATRIAYPIGLGIALLITLLFFYRMFWRKRG